MIRGCLAGLAILLFAAGVNQRELVAHLYEQNTRLFWVVVAYASSVLLFAAFYLVGYRRRRTRFIFAKELEDQRRTDERLRIERELQDCRLTQQNLGVFRRKLRRDLQQLVWLGNPPDADDRPRQADAAQPQDHYPHRHDLNEPNGSKGVVAKVPNGKVSIYLLNATPVKPQDREQFGRYAWYYSISVSDEASRYLDSTVVRFPCNTMLDRRVCELIVESLLGKAKTRATDRAEALNRLNQGRGYEWGYWDFAYFSLIVQSTVGFGDILPNSRGIRLLVALQVALGIVLLGVAINVSFSRDKDGPLSAGTDANLRIGEQVKVSYAGEEILGFIQAIEAEPRYVVKPLWGEAASKANRDIRSLRVGRKDLTPLQSKGMED